MMSYNHLVGSTKIVIKIMIKIIDYFFLGRSADLIFLGFSFFLLFFFLPLFGFQGKSHQTFPKKGNNRFPKKEKKDV